MRSRGFTLVELLIVIVVVAILVTISIVAYDGIQERARDAQRRQDVGTIIKALEMYYVDHGEYPLSNCGSSCPTPKKVNSWWATTSDGSWQVLADALVPEYISELPEDPQASTDADPAQSGGYNYDYTSYSTSCGLDAEQSYRIIYRLESDTQERVWSGECPNGATLFIPSDVSGYAMAK